MRQPYEILDEGTGNQRLQRDIEALQEQVRELKDKQTETDKTLAEQIKDLNQFVFLNVAPMINFIDNGDFVFNQLEFAPGTVYGGAADDLANWYVVGGITTGSNFIEHTTAVRGSGIAFVPGVPPGSPLGAAWFRAEGSLVWVGSAALCTPLPKNVAFPGSTFYCRLQVKKDVGAVLQPTWRLRATLFANNSGGGLFVEGDVINLSAIPAFAAPGAFQRQYILRVDTPTAFFYSEVITPVTVNNQVSVLATDNINFVTVSWPVFPNSTKYRLYRWDSQTTQWRLIADIRNGANSFRDVGGVSGELFTPPVNNRPEKAEATFVNFGQYVTEEYQDAVFTIFVPTNYNYASTTGKQSLVLDIVDENLNSAGSPLLFIDKVALSYTNGRFTYSAKDLSLNAAIQATTPPPVPPPGGDEGDGGGTPPPVGGGSGGRPIGSCVKPDTKILISVDDLWIWKSASEVEVGDYVVTGTKNYSKVVEVVRGTTSRFHVITTKSGKQLWCTPSHRVMQPLKNTEIGTLAFEIKTRETVWIVRDAQIDYDTVVAVEVIDTPNMHPVITFKLAGEHTYIADGIVSHNMKPIE